MIATIRVADPNEALIKSFNADTEGLRVISIRHLVCGLLVLGNAAAVAVSAPVEDRVVIDGDGSLLALIADAQVSMQASRPRGSVKAKITQLGSVEYELDVQHLWDNQNRYWRYSGKVVYRFPSEEPRQEAIKNVHIIQRPDAKLIYNPGGRFVTHITRRSDVRRVDDVLLLDPERCWYAYERGKRSWHWMLSPESVGRFVSRFVVRKSDNLVVIERHLREGGVLRVEASLAHGGNIIAHRSDGNKAGISSSGTYAWAQDAQGGWYLKEAKMTRSRGSAKEPDWSYHVRIEEFDPAPAIPRNRFELSSLSIAQGTTIYVHGVDGKVNRSWRHGEQPGATLSQAELDELSRKLGQGGFAGRSRGN